MFERNLPEIINWLFATKGKGLTPMDDDKTTVAVITFQDFLDLDLPAGYYWYRLNGEVKSKWMICQVRNPPKGYQGHNIDGFVDFFGQVSQHFSSGWLRDCIEFGPIIAPLIT